MSLQTLKGITGYHGLEPNRSHLECFWYIYSFTQYYQISKRESAIALLEAE